MSKRLFDALWLLALGVYIAAGMPIATFHGDEAMQVYMSHDYATAFIYREPQRLMTNPPYDIDSEPQLRLINGSINRYAIGLSWHLAGFTNGDLPPRPGWDWGLDYDTNVATDHRPPEALMLAARASSTLFLALSAGVIFGLGWQLGGRPLAYFASLIYALHPVILLNGRRAMMEGSMLFFGLLIILLAAVISRRREQGVGWWIGLTLAGGLALASKHTAVIFVVSAFGWIFAAEALRFNLRYLLTTTAKLTISFAGVVAIFIALSPALWNEPLARFQDLINARAYLVEIQVAGAPMSTVERVISLFFQPFMVPLAHFELAPWREYAVITAEIQRYMASPWSGLHFGSVLGAILTLLAVMGLAVIAVPRRRIISSGQAAGLLVWLLVTCAALLANPLPWQRYYLPLIPIAILLAGITVLALIRFVSRLRQEKSAIVTIGVPAETGH